MKIGFTGTQEGMTLAQMTSFKNFIIEIKPTEFRHGDCKGADAQADKIVKTVGGIPIIIHPPINSKKRAFCIITINGKILPAKDYLDRNHDIVDNTDMLIATPATTTEVLRSGTWSTIRYCKKSKKTVVIINPNGNFDYQ